jgi:tripartite-type tricarboxylate transporter receptor subunit TctC
MGAIAVEPAVSAIDRRLRMAWRAALVVCVLTAPYVGAEAQERFPSRPVTLVLATAAGGVADAVARIMQPLLSEHLGQPVVIENRPGAAGVLGATSVAKSAPDGYTVLLNIESHVINQVAAASPPYDAVRDFAPVSMLAQVSHMIAVPSILRLSNVGDFVSYAKERPGKLNFGSPGRLTSVYLLSEEFKVRSSLDMLHIPYKGGPQVTQALMTNEVQFAILSLPPFRAAIDAGAITPIAVAGQKRLAEMPNVPTMVESGYPDFISHTWIAAFVPAGTPAPVIKRLNAEFAAALADAKVRDGLIKAGFDPVGSTPEELGAEVKREADHWSKFIKDNHIQFD